jgi:hypothetical protein
VRGEWYCILFLLLFLFLLLLLLVVVVLLLLLHYYHYYYYHQSCCCWEISEVYCSEGLRHYPLVLLVKVVWKQGKVLGSEEGKVMGSGLLGECGRGKALSDWT